MTILGTVSRLFMDENWLTQRNKKGDQLESLKFM